MALTTYRQAPRLNSVKKVAVVTKEEGTNLVKLASELRDAKLADDLKTLEKIALGEL